MYTNLLLLTALFAGGLGASLGIMAYVLACRIADACRRARWKRLLAGHITHIRPRA